MKRIFIVSNPPRIISAATRFPRTIAIAVFNMGVLKR